MAFRGGFGPVYASEWLTATRRWQMYAGRSTFIGLILLGLGIVWGNYAQRADLAEIKVQAEIAQQFYTSVVSIALMMVLLAAPAATAGAICLDKARGTLFHVLVTDLSYAEIVLGKLAARLGPVLGLIAGSLPVLALMTLLGGVDPIALTGSFLVLLALALLGCALALALSVWGRKTHEVLLATYLVWVLWSLLLPGAALVSWYLGAGMNAPAWISRLNPFVLALAVDDTSAPIYAALGDQLLFLAAAACISTALIALTMRRLRPVVVGQWSRAEGSRPSRLGAVLVRTALGRSRPAVGPGLDGNPVLWREWHRRRPSGWARIIWGAYLILVLGSGAVAIDLAAFRRMSPSGEIPALIVGFQVALGLLLLTVSSATSLSEERSRGSLDVLLATPLSTASILWGKWWGAFRGVILVAILPTLLATVGCRAGRWLGPPLVLGLVLAYGAVITGVGLALATWIRRTGRVLALCVALYVGASIGWVAVAALLANGGPANSTLQVAMGSPFWGIGVLTIAVVERIVPPDVWPSVGVAALYWIVIDCTAAALLMAATRHTFDRCLGRMPERPIVPPHVPRGWKPQPKPAAVILDEV
jgi:ABC-type transport system involved in multi-copper enzyme maturation permease subunit